MRENKKLQTAFNQYREQTDEIIEQARVDKLEYEKAVAFNEINYTYGDTDYGFCGVAETDVFTDMVVDWRADPVYVPSEKTAYLTFDDGPSDRTLEILDTLDKYNVKATFFVIGTKNEAFQEVYKEIVDRGHTLGMHSQNHVYADMYGSLEDFLGNFNELFSTLVEKTGTRPILFRFPGGSTNALLDKTKTFDAIKQEMEVRGFTYYDWNVSAEDAKYSYVSADAIAKNVLNGAKNKDVAIILLHDSQAKIETAKAVPAIIEGLQAQGFVLDKLTPEVKPVQFR